MCVCILCAYIHQHASVHNHPYSHVCHTRSPSSDMLTSQKDTEVSGATDCPKPRQWLWPGGVSKQDIILRLFTVINSLQTGHKASHRIARHMLVLHI